MLQGLSKTSHAFKLDAQLPDVTVELVNCGGGQQERRRTKRCRNHLGRIFVHMAADIVGYGEESGWTEHLQRKIAKQNTICADLSVG